MNRFVLKNDGLIIYSYLPHKENAKLEFALGQCPQIWRTNWPVFSQKINKSARANLTSKFLTETDNNLEKLIRSLAFEILPICYLEGFSELNRLSEEMPWPEQPKFIFTSNSFDCDEVSNLRSTKISKGTKYYVGQHGHKYGTHYYANRNY